MASSFAQDSDVQKNNWLLGVIFKLGNMSQGNGRYSEIHTGNSETESIYQEISGHNKTGTTKKVMRRLK